MKKTFLTLIAFFTILSCWAVPSQKGKKKTFTLNDGSKVEAMLMGDENGHWWQCQDGKCLSVTDNSARVLTEGEFASLLQHAGERSQLINAARLKRLTMDRTVSVSGKKKTIGHFQHFTGTKKGLVILVNFSDKCMKTSRTEFINQFNEIGYCQNGHIGSVKDYFSDQSYNKFTIDFDVVGPYSLSKSITYYGENDENDNDMHPGEMIIEACKLADAAGTDFSKYDWDGDGSVDQVYVVYAGYGENAGAPSYTIWPHEYTLAFSKTSGDGSGAQTFDGVQVDTYACSCELADDSGNIMDGIGTACHEFSHCMGYPDLYDTKGSGLWGTQYWDLLGNGSYNGPEGMSAVPCGYSAYERWMAGWLEPTVLEGGDEITGMKDLGSTPEAYVLYNDGHTDEYYLLENHANTKWFGYWHGSKADRQGMLITHVDFDQKCWENNVVNAKYTGYNDHCRLTPFLCNNDEGYLLGRQWSVYYEQLKGHLYPYNGNDSLTPSSTPQAMLYNANLSDNKYSNVSIKDIKLAGDGTMSFRAVQNGPATTYLFRETFDKCSGSGGNDDRGFSGSAVATLTSRFMPDNDGWTATHDKMFGGYKCAKFGSALYAGYATTPEFTMNGDATLKFTAAASTTSLDGTTLTVLLDGEKIANFTLTRGAWKNFSTEISGKGSHTLTFSVDRRYFFLDAVSVVKNETTGIDDIQPSASSSRHSTFGAQPVYNLLGQKVGKDAKGLVIVNGKKIIR